MENHIEDLFLSPGSPFPLLPVPAELKAGCVLFRMSLATLEQSKSQMGLSPLKQPQQRGHPLPRDVPRGAGPATGTAKPPYNVWQERGRDGGEAAGQSFLQPPAGVAHPPRRPCAQLGCSGHQTPWKCLPKGQPSFPSWFQLGFWRNRLQRDMLFASDPPSSCLVVGQFRPQFDNLNMNSKDNSAPTILMKTRWLSKRKEVLLVPAVRDQAAG